MPYEVTFSKRLVIADREQYINECCVGGDQIVSRLLPTVREQYTDIQTEQEDWGWFIWFRKGNVRLAIDVFTDDPEAGAADGGAAFRVHLISRVKKWLGHAVSDTPELEAVRQLVVERLSGWTDTPAIVEHLDSSEF